MVFLKSFLAGSSRIYGQTLGGKPRKVNLELNTLDGEQTPLAVIGEGKGDQGGRGGD